MVNDCYDSYGGYYNIYKKVKYMFMSCSDGDIKVKRYRKTWKDQTYSVICILHVILSVLG